VHQPELGSSLRRIRLRTHHEFARAPLTHRGAEHLQRDPRERHPDPDLGHPDPGGFLGHQHHVRARREHAAAGDRGPVHGGDERLRQLECRPERVGQRRQEAVDIRIAPCGAALEIDTCREGTVRSGDDNGARGIGREPAEAFGERPAQLEIHGVDRPVRHPQHRDRDALDVDIITFEHGLNLPMHGSPARGPASFRGGGAQGARRERT
jgi:hypothetical protein